jgi:hypothetical protein
LPDSVDQQHSQRPCQAAREAAHSRWSLLGFEGASCLGTKPFASPRWPVFLIMVPSWP